MMDDKFVFTINHENDIPKFQQLVDAVHNAIATNVLTIGDLLPSVNSICKNTNLSRDTVFKAYSVLKDQKVVESVPNKGYFVAGETRKVLLILDTFKAYKEVLYHSFVNNLPENIITDVQFHHYNIENFKNIIHNSVGKYSKYVIMNFDNAEVATALEAISDDKLLLIDWNIHVKPNNNFVFQDFGRAFYDALEKAITLFKKYKELVFVYPDYTYHPQESEDYFLKFCATFAFDFSVIKNTKNFKIEKNKAYISVSDRFLGLFLEQCRENNFEPGEDVGMLSYNDTPMKKFIYKGISVITTDFKEMGTKGAEFVALDAPLKMYVPTQLIIRESL